MTSPTKSINILLVEDDDGDAKALQRAFDKANIKNTVIRAVDGIDALDILKGQNGRKSLEHPYLLLVDLNLPRMNGIEFLQALRADKDLRKSVVFMLTTSKREEDKADAYNLNVAGYIVKEKAGEDFLNLASLIDTYWRIVELS